MSMDSSDWFVPTETSECCGAPVYNPADCDIGICMKCKEWTEVIHEDGTSV